MRTTSTLVCITGDSAARSSASSCAIRARSPSATFCRPAMLRSSTIERRCARSPLSMPSEVALSGELVSNCSAVALNSLSAAASAEGAPCAQAGSVGKAASVAVEARNWRRLAIMAAPDAREGLVAGVTLAKRATHATPGWAVARA
ncbi:hypothetical protein [Sphingomonas sp. J344]|uniref:hypothetical protein n=1 Tax=Sphingomonas sp. J344 TaxID=2898434 RepID=UPI0027E30E29|nr:hypothetical protein [Sphingomonas sp. J344]